MNISQIISLLPKTCSYYFECNFSFESKIGEYFNENFDTIAEQFSSINISCIRIFNILSSGEFCLIKAILSSKNSKIYLNLVHLYLDTFEETVELLNLLSDCLNLETIEITYREEPASEIVDSDKIIKELKQKIYNRSFGIRKIKIIYNSELDN